MGKIWRNSLGLTLGLLVGTARAGETGWLRVPVLPETVPVTVTLGRPTALNPQAPGIALGQPQGEAPVLPVAYSAPAGPVIRAQSPDPGTPPPPVPASPNIPTVPPPANERFNCGVVTEPPVPAAPAGHPFLSGLHNLFGSAGSAVGGLFTGQGTAGRSAFESDHAFDVVSSPVSNPFLFEDPRALTELRPLFIHQGTSTKNGVFHGGDIDYFGLQARLALTERLSVVMSELGFLWVEPHNAASGYGAHDGISELRIGPKYTFYRCEPSGTVVAVGLNFDIPIGPGKVFQDTGSLSLEPYLSFGQNFLKSSFGSFNFLSTLGYSVGTDSKRSDFFYSSYHLDYDVANLHNIYPLIEFNYFHYTAAGTARPLGFEGRELINFGATGVSGRDYLSMAVGARYKFSECVQTGLAVEFPLTGPHDLLDYGVHFDVIFRW